MKRLLLALFLVTTSAATVSPVVATAQGTQNPPVAQSVFVAKYNQWNTHVLNNQLNLANQDFEQLKPMFVSNFAQGKIAIQNAATQTEKQTLLNKLRDKQTLYTDIMKLASDMTTNRPAIKQKFDEYAALYDL